MSDPGKISSVALPLFVGSMVAVFAIPHDNALETVLSYGLATLLGGGAAAALLGGFAVKALQDE